MASRINTRLRKNAVIAAITVLILILPFTCGCLDVEPEELPPGGALTLPVTTVSAPVPADTIEIPTIPPPPVTITSPKQVQLFTERDFPPEVKEAISDFTTGKTSAAINGFLRWESVRARTNKEDTAVIQKRIGLIDYAFFNTTLKENVSVYVGLSGEQARQIRNESTFSENGYAIASYDPSVVYHRLANSARDSDGYLTMCVIDFVPGNRILFVNATEREFLLPRGGIWDIAREDTHEELEYSIDSIPRYDDIIPLKVRLIHTKEHP